ncbi:DUF4251 domain-containing protein [Flavihumibacter sp. R14]|nr:DUF4251 domain-containing protein [Flavihumibacter soli]
MKSQTALLLLIILSCISIRSGSLTTATEGQSAKETDVQKLLKSRTYRFVPQSVQTQTGRSIQINNYSLEIRNDTLVSHLPYYGKAYSGSVGATDSPLDFKATNIKYTSEAGKKDRTQINIRPEDPKIDAQEFSMSVSSSGYANLSVQFNNRQPVSFYGEISSLPVKKKRN